MANQRRAGKRLTPVQHTIIPSGALPEAIFQFLFLAAIVAALEWFDARSGITLFVLLIVGFSLNTMNIIAASLSQNIHLAEIRDELLRQGGETESQAPSISN